MDQQPAKFISIIEAAKISPGHTTPNTIWRWCRKGLFSRTGDRIRLDHVRIGGKIYISPEALDAFFKQIAQADMAYFEKDPTRIEPVSRKRPNGRREKEIQAAEEFCKAKGA